MPDQRSVLDQLHATAILANRHGLYDAADLIQSHLCEHAGRTAAECLEDDAGVAFCSNETSQARLNVDLNTAARWADAETRIHEALGALAAALHELDSDPAAGMVPVRIEPGELVVDAARVDIRRLYGPWQIVIRALLREVNRWRTEYESLRDASSTAAEITSVAAVRAPPRHVRRNLGRGVWASVRRRRS
jgi:hypothetical protein